MNAYANSRLKRLIIPVSAAAVATLAFLVVAILVEYQYSKHYFSVNYWWYQFSAAFLFWENLSFAFFLNYGKTESTSLLALVLGAAGLLVWKCLAIGNFPRGVGLAMVTTSALSYAASFLTRQATFPELLALMTVQMAVVIVFCACCRRAAPLRFSTRNLMVFSLMVALFLVVPGLLDPQRSIGAIVLLDRSYPHGRVNIFLLLLGLSAGLTTVAFLSNPMTRFRWAYMVAVAFGFGALGYGLAWMFETLPAMQWGHGNLAAVNFNAISFRYGYAVLFPFSGFISVAILPVATRLF